MVINTKKDTIPITELEQSAFCQTDSELKSKSLQEEFESGVRWQKITTSYLKMSPDELDNQISKKKQQLGNTTIVLGHHYQRNEIIKFADFRGDSFKLSQLAAENRDAENIIFCGVHFMAETADILSGENQRVILPNLTAGCSMADMAHIDDVEDCWDDLTNVIGNGQVTPITYMNSTAAIKALCGQNDGIVCTSSNAKSTFEWAFEKSDKILFLPDQHLGRNTAHNLGIKLEEMVTWNPFKPMGGNSEKSLKQARMILWEGHCSVHTRFTTEQIQTARNTYPDINVIVHPECVLEVVEMSDFNGSTEYISKTISQAPPGSSWAVGTEISLVKRIAQQNPDKTIFCLDSVICPCSTMYRVHPAYLLWIMDGLIEGVVVNQITVDKETANQARLALTRMLSIK